MSQILFTIGALMLAYDILGHACCAVARMTGQVGARVWNAHSQKVWPSIQNSIHYDLHWTGWHSVSLLLMCIAYATK